MRWSHVAAGIAAGVWALAGLPGAASAGCPAEKRVEEIVAKFEAPDRRLLLLRPTAYPGLCEAHVQLNGKTHIFYTGPGGEYFLMGQLYDAASGRNVTRETIEAMTLFSPEEMARLAELSAFRIGRGGKTLFYVTDPQCPYCKKGYDDLRQMADAGEIQVFFLLYPLDSHKGAREQSIATICDGKGLAEFENGYRSDNLCAEGQRKIDAARELLARKNVSGTPAYIFPDRRFHSGLMEAEELRRRLGLKTAAPPAKPPAKQSP